MRTVPDLTDPIPSETIHPSDYSNSPCIFLLRDKYDTSLAEITDDIPIGLALQKRNAEQERINQEAAAANNSSNIPSHHGSDASTPPSLLRNNDHSTNQGLEQQPTASPPTRPATTESSNANRTGVNPPPRDSNGKQHPHGHDSAIVVGTPVPRRTMSTSSKPSLGLATNTNATSGANSCTGEQSHHRSPASPNDEDSNQHGPSFVPPTISPSELNTPPDAPRMPSSAPQTPGFASRFRLRRSGRSHSTQDKYHETNTGYFPSTPGAHNNYTRLGSVTQVVGHVPLSDDDPFTLESFGRLVAMHADRDCDMIVARVRTIDPRDATRFNYFHYAAHHLNKILFRTEPERGLLHRVRTKNPLSNDCIHGKVDYFVIKASIARAWSNAYRKFNKEQKRKTTHPNGITIAATVTTNTTSANSDVNSLSIKADDDDDDEAGLHKLPSDATILSRWTTRTFMEVTSQETPDVLHSGRCSPVPTTTVTELTQVKVVATSPSSPSPIVISPTNSNGRQFDATSTASIDTRATSTNSSNTNNSDLSLTAEPLLPKSSSLSSPSLSHRHANTRISLDIPASSLSSSHRTSSLANLVSVASSMSAPSSPSLSSSSTTRQPITAASLCNVNDTDNTNKSECRGSSPSVQSSTSTDVNAPSSNPHHRNFSTPRRCHSLTTHLSSIQHTNDDDNDDNDMSTELQHTYKAAARLRRASRAIPAIDMGNSQPATRLVSPIEPRTSPNWLVGRYIGNDYDFLYKAPIRQFFAKNALEPDDALLFPLHSRPRPVLPHHRWMRPLVPLLRFDSDQIGSVMDGEFPRPEEQQRGHQPNPMANMSWIERFHYVLTTGLLDCLRHRRTRWFTVVYIAAAIGIVLFFIPPTSVVIVGVALLFVFLLAFGWALAAYC